MTRRRAKRDTYCYELKDKGKVVYRGITTDVERRVSEHAREGKRFTTYCYDTVPLSRKSANEAESDGVDTYRRGHGKRPRYNRML
jgi:predicted GIY-YIG superfamily endonuclease